ncbi:hypothetical protein ACJX0J_035554, partial [Zea mays]
MAIEAHEIHILMEEFENFCCAENKICMCQKLMWELLVPVFAQNAMTAVTMKHIDIIIIVMYKATLALRSLVTIFFKKNLWFFYKTKLIS